ncbi:MAG: hypothetical protein QXQ31_08445 [Zestosphaera sp.]
MSIADGAVLVLRLYMESSDYIYNYTRYSVKNMENVYAKCIRFCRSSCLE